MKTPNEPKSKTIIFTRHAIALDHAIAAEKNIPDPKRELTPAGIKKFETYVKKHKKLFKNVDVFITSPYARAQQTLDIILKTKSTKKQKVKVFKHLRCDDSPKPFLKYIAATKAKKIVAVSHEPFMSHLLKALLGASWKSEKIKKGHAIKIQLRKKGERHTYKMF